MFLETFKDLVGADFFSEDRNYPERKTSHSFPCSARVKNVWSFTSKHLYRKTVIQSRSLSL